MKDSEPNAESIDDEERPPYDEVVDLVDALKLDAARAEIMLLRAH